MFCLGFEEHGIVFSELGWVLYKVPGGTEVLSLYMTHALVGLIEKHSPGPSTAKAHDP